MPKVSFAISDEVIRDPGELSVKIRKQRQRKKKKKDVSLKVVGEECSRLNTTSFKAQAKA